MKRLILLLLALSLLFVGCGKDEPIPDPNEGLQQAYTFTMSDVNGNTLQLSSLLDKPIVLNFWASWCPPCKAELGDFEKAFQKYGSQVNFVMLSVDDSIDEARTIVSLTGIEPICLGTINP